MAGLLARRAVVWPLLALPGVYILWRAQMGAFGAFGFKPSLIKGVARAGYTDPTPIQAGATFSLRVMQSMHQRLAPRPDQARVASSGRTGNHIRST